eukprot:982931-Prymnesium_polylepis.1
MPRASSAGACVAFGVVQAVIPPPFNSGPPRRARAVGRDGQRRPRLLSRPAPVANRRLRPRDDGVLRCGCPRPVCEHRSITALVTSTFVARAAERGSVALSACGCKATAVTGNGEQQHTAEYGRGCTLSIRHSNEFHCGAVLAAAFRADPDGRVTFDFVPFVMKPRNPRARPRAQCAQGAGGTASA